MAVLPGAGRTAGRSRRLFFWLRIAATTAAWVVFIVYAHALAHAYETELARILASPFAKVAAATLILTALVYFIALSFPFVPRLGCRSAAVIFIWSALLVVGHSVSHESFHELRASLASMPDQIGLIGVIVIASVYALALALPFVPAVELGLLIIALFGLEGAAVAYGATVAGLGMAFAAGCLVPEAVIRAALTRVGMTVAPDQLDTRMRSVVMRERPTTRWVERLGRVILQHRYLTLAVCLNFPGNSVLGGGGGLAVLSGMSRRFDWRGFVVTVALATAPLPLLVLTGVIDVQPVLEHHGHLHDFLEGIGRLFVHP